MAKLTDAGPSLVKHHTREKRRENIFKTLVVYTIPDSPMHNLDPTIVSLELYSFLSPSFFPFFPLHEIVLFSSSGYYFSA